MLDARLMSLSLELFRSDFVFSVRPGWNDQLLSLWIRSPCFGVFMEVGRNTVIFALSWSHGYSMDGFGSVLSIALGL